MTALRIILGLCAALGSAGWILLAIAAHNFRTSFGASPVAAIRLVALPIALALVLVTVIFPAQRWLLHTAAAVLAVAVIGSILVLRESVFVGVTGLVFFGAWYPFYWLALRPVSG